MCCTSRRPPLLPGRRGQLRILYDLHDLLGRRLHDLRRTRFGLPAGGGEQEPHGQCLLHDLSPGTARNCGRRGPYCPWAPVPHGSCHRRGGLTEWIVWPYRGRMQSFDRQSRDACQEPDGPGQRTARISRAMRCRSAMSNGLVSTGTFTSSMKP